jgi:D-xylose transport system permease protein
VVYALVLLVGTMTVLTSLQGKPNYLAPINLSNILNQGSHVAILAIFTTIVLIGGNFDLSISSIAALGAVVTIQMLNYGSPTLAIILPLVIGLVFGLVNGLLVQKLGINAFIVTLATMTIGRGLILLVTNTRTVTNVENVLSPLQNGTWTIPNLLTLLAVLAALTAGVVLLLRERIGDAVRYARRVGAVAVILLVAGFLVNFNLTLTRPTYYLIALTVIASLMLRFTVMGRRLYAVGGNAEAARLSGINVDRYRIGTFALNGLASGFIGILFAARLGAVNPDALSGAELTAIAASILGGTSLFGGAGFVIMSVVGALILFVLNNGFNILNMGSEYQEILKGLVIIGAAASYTISASRALTKTSTPDPAGVARAETASGQRDHKDRTSGVVEGSVIPAEGIA